jgi:D-lactate dehydrogenase
MAHHASVFSIPPKETKMPDTTYQRFHARLKSFIPESRLATDPLRTLAHGTDASFYRLIPKVVIRADNEGEVSETLKLAGQAISDAVLLVAGETWQQWEATDCSSLSVVLPAPHPISRIRRLLGVD